MVFTEFTQLLMKNSVFLGITIAVIASFVNQLVISFINDIIMPIIDRDGDENNEPDINKIANYTIKTGGITFRIGSFIIALIRFILLIFIIYILCLVLLKINKN